MKCSNGEKRSCDANQECYATEAFVYNQWSDGCRVPGNTFDNKFAVGVKLNTYDSIC